MTSAGPLAADEPAFSASFSRLQANMDPQHRDRIAFVRICSGRFVRGMDVQHVRTGKTLTLSRSVQFMARRAPWWMRPFPAISWACGIRGFCASATSLCEAQPLEFEASRAFRRTFRARAPPRSAQAKTAQEGAGTAVRGRGGAGVLRSQRMERDPILGAVGAPAVRSRRAPPARRYGVRIGFRIVCPTASRAGSKVTGVDFDQLEAARPAELRGRCRRSAAGLVETEYLLRRTEEKYQSVTFISAVQPGRSHRAAA